MLGVLSRQTRQARGLSVFVLVIASRAIIARVLEVFFIFVVYTILPFGAVFAFRLAFNVAVFARAAWCALGAAFRVGELSGFTGSAVGEIGSIANFTTLTLMAYFHARFVAKLAGQTRQA